MAAELLVETQIDDGQRLVEQLVRDSFEVTVAFWFRTSEEDLWHLYIASPLVDAEKPGDAYRYLYASLSKLPGSWIQLSDIKLVNDANPIARAAMAVRDRYPARLATRYGGKRLGNVPIEEAYIYQRPDNELKTRRFLRVRQRLARKRLGPSTSNKHCQASLR
jgi:hypothetical protein